MNVRIIIVLFLLGTLLACGSSSSDSAGSGEELILNTDSGYAQCYGRVDGYNDFGESIIATVNEYIPTDAEIQCTDRYKLTVEGREVEAVYISYGELNDCMSGCFSSDICVIYDNGDPLLYSASWVNSAEYTYDSEGNKILISETIETPLNLEAGGCLNLTENAYSTAFCEEGPEAVAHPVFESDSFIAFLTEVGDSWRFCGTDFYP